MTPKVIFAVLGIVCAVLSVAISVALLLPAAVVFIGVAVLLP